MEQTTTQAAADRGEDVSIDEIMADPEIAALLDFEPVVRKQKKSNSWTPDAQRKFVALLAHLGSKTQAATSIGRDASGASKLCKSQGGESFADACDAAADLHQSRLEALAAANPGRPWSERRSTRSRRTQEAPLPGEVLNEHGEYEDEASYRARGEQAADSICGKLLRIRRLFLQEISGCPGKRAAFEILTGHAVDWKKAAKLQPQDDEPYRTANQRQPDMVLLADSGWSWGDFGYGPQRMAELRRDIDEYREAEGMPRSIGPKAAPSAATPARSAAGAARRDANPKPAGGAACIEQAEPVRRGHADSFRMTLLPSLKKGLINEQQ